MSPLRIGVDIDGVLADYCRAMKDAADELGIEIEGRSDPATYGMVEDGWFESKDDWKACHARVTGNLTSMELLDPDAPRRMRELADRGHEVVLITARAAPPWQSDYDDEQVERQTRAWLDANDMPYDLELAQDKTGGQVDILVDDAPHNIEAYQATGEGVVIFDHAYNGHLEGPRVGTMAAFARHVETLEGREPSSSGLRAVPGPGGPQPRVPAGNPAGGQFAAVASAEVDIAL